MPSKKSDRALDAVPSVPFDALPAAHFAKMAKEQLESTCNKIIIIIAGNTTIAEKQTVLKYLELLSSNSDAANILTNGPIILLLVKLLRQSKASALRAQLASLIGLLIRHSTYVSDEFDVQFLEGGEDDRSFIGGGDGWSCRVGRGRGEEDDLLQLWVGAGGVASAETGKMAGVADFGGGRR